MSLQELIHISRIYGGDPDFVLANGGNTSFKDENTMWVKASGVALAGIDESGFVQMDREKLAAIWNKTYPEDPDKREDEALADLMAARLPGQNKRPSVEALLHALFPQKYVIHLHPALVNGMTCGKNGETAAAELFPSGSVWVPVVNPGYILAKTIKDIIDVYTADGNEFPEIVFLQNHGVFAAADSTDGIKKIYNEIIQTIEGRIDESPDLEDLSADSVNGDDVELWNKAVKAVLEKPECRFISNKEIARFVESQQAFMPLSSAFTPDHIVYYGHKPLFIEQAGGEGEDREVLLKSALQKYSEEYPSNPPRVAAVKGLGVFAAGDTADRVDLMADLFNDAVKIAVYSRSFGGPQFMPKDKIDFIVNWEVEKYRASLQGK